MEKLDALDIRILNLLQRDASLGVKDISAIIGLSPSPTYERINRLKREGIIELPSGIQYEIMKEGSGEKPDLKDKIKAHYAGRLINGKEFDSSYGRGAPFTAPILHLIKGCRTCCP